MYVKDKEYMAMVADIFKNEKFGQTLYCKHHGLTRIEHSLRVSYYSYKVAKKLRLDVRATARAGLLHDFFVEGDLIGYKEKLSLFFHPYKSLENANKYFELNEMEKDIIISHMFPTLPHKVPKYLESWLVSIVDKIVATYEFAYSYGKPLLYKFSNAYLWLILFIKY